MISTSITENPEAYRRSHLKRVVSESPGRNASEPICPRKDKPEGRASTFLAKAAWDVARTEAAQHLGGVGRDRKVMLSNWRSLPLPVGKSAEQGSRISSLLPLDIVQSRQQIDIFAARR